MTIRPVLVFYSNECIVPKTFLYLLEVSELLRFYLSSSGLWWVISPSLHLSSLSLPLCLSPLPFPVLSPSQPFNIPLVISIIISVSFLSAPLFLLLSFYSSPSQKPPTQTFKKSALFSVFTFIAYIHPSCSPTLYLRQQKDFQNQALSSKTVIVVASSTAKL